MGKFQDLLNLRLKQRDTEKNKMVALAEKTSSGELSSFSGVFRVNALNQTEKSSLAKILESFRVDEHYDVSQDLTSLTTLTAEVKAITNQAVILHGERIKKAQTILKSYKDGAFTAWLIATYGNRQTPYNFLQYYDFYMSMPTHLHGKIDNMPRQAVYSLASRSGELNKKEEIVDTHFAEAKIQLLQIIRDTFPLPDEDKRNANEGQQILSFLQRVLQQISNKKLRLEALQKERIENILHQMLSLLNKK